MDLRIGVLGKSSANWLIQKSVSKNPVAKSIILKKND